VEHKAPGPSKGYQKQIKKDVPKARPLSKAKGSSSPDYSSAAAKKWPLFIEAVESGNVEVVNRLIAEGFNINVSRDGTTPLMGAASKGRIEIAEAIIHAGANVNARSDAGWTALHVAAFDQTQSDIVDLLMQSGVDIEARNKAGKTALQLAEEKGHRDIVRVMKAHLHRLRVDAQEWEAFLSTPEGRPYQQQRRYDSLALLFKLWWLPPLILGGAGLLLGYVIGVAVLTGIIGLALGLVFGLSILFVEKKLRRYLDDIGSLPYLDIHIVREKRKAGEPITLESLSNPPASEEADEQSVDTASADWADDRFLDAQSRDGERSSLTKRMYPTIVPYAIGALVVAILVGAIVIKRTALTHWYYATRLERSGLRFSSQDFLNEVSKNNGEAFDLFVKAGVDLDAVNEKGQTALMLAAEKGHVRILQTLAKLNAPSLNHADKSGNTALMTAARLGQEHIVQALVESGADVNFTVPSSGDAASALQAALDTPDVKEEQMRVIQYLLQKGADVKGRNKAGRFPLLFAVDHGQTETVKMLIEHGADVNEADVKGGFALLTAACNGYPVLVTLLAEHGANMKMALPDGQTPLICAVKAGRADTVKALLEKGAPVNARTSGGDSALTEAARAGAVAVVQLLLARGADPGNGYVPDAFLRLNGRTIAFTAKKVTLKGILERIAKTASQDGYKVTFGALSKQNLTFTAKGSWNKVLRELSMKNHLLLVVKEGEVFVVPYDPAAIKHELI
jgi:ankyrin repeat protein